MGDRLEALNRIADAVFAYKKGGKEVAPKSDALATADFTFYEFFAGGGMARAGLGKDVTPHVLRHTCASWLLWEGQTIWDVAGVIGADASTVERVYGHHRRIDAAERKRA